jgi:hypothetical protein
LKQYIGEKIRWDMVRWWATHVSCSVFLCSFFLRIILSCDRLAMPPTNFPLLDPTTSTSWDKCTDVTFAPRRVPWVKLEASIPVYYIYIFENMIIWYIYVHIVTLYYLCFLILCILQLKYI